MNGPEIRVGFVGLGSQGGPIAMRMARQGVPLQVWDLRRAAMDACVSEGAQAATGLVDLAASCEHVGVCVVDDAGVLEVCDQLIPAMRAGSCLAIHSTILPETCMALEERCTERGILFVDAPVSGGGIAASAGTLTIMCGATAKAFDKARPVFESFGSAIVLLGPVGSGQQAKIVNNALVAANIGAAWSAIEAAQALGMDRKVFEDLIRLSSGYSRSFDLAARLSAPSDFAHAAGLLKKDVDLLDRILKHSPSAIHFQQSSRDFIFAALNKSSAD